MYLACIGPTQHCFVPNGRRSQQFIENVQQLFKKFMRPGHETINHVE